MRCHLVEKLWSGHTHLLADCCCWTSEVVCKDNWHTFLQEGWSSCHPTNDIKALTLPIKIVYWPHSVLTYQLTPQERTSRHTHGVTPMRVSHLALRYFGFH